MCQLLVNKPNKANSRYLLPYLGYTWITLIKLSCGMQTVLHGALRETFSQCYHLSWRKNLWNYLLSCLIVGNENITLTECVFNLNFVIKANTYLYKSKKYIKTEYKEYPYPFPSLREFASGYNLQPRSYNKKTNRNLSVTTIHSYRKTWY